MSFVAEWIIHALNADRSPGLAGYCQALRAACETAPPPFGTQRYGEVFRAAAADPDWLAASLVTNAQREAEGAARLWSLAASTTDPRVAGLVKQHAVDESRHARWYITILDLAFPGALDESMRAHADAISPRYTVLMVPQPEAGSPFAHQVTLDDLVQMNIAEIRTAINQQLQLPVLMAYCGPERQSKLAFVLKLLARYELDHIGYSARLIGELAKDADGGCLADLVTERVQDFNEITCAEVELGVFPLHCSSRQCVRGAGAPPTCARARRAAPVGEPSPA